MSNMSEYFEELWVGIKADITGLRQGMMEARRSTKGFMDNIAASSSELKKFGRNITFISAGLVGFGTLINRTFVQFEQSMANTFSVIGATQAEMKKLTNYARHLGETTIFTASQAADAMYYLASAGFKTNQIMAALEHTLSLSAATQYLLSDTTRVVVSALNAWQLEASEASRVTNTFAAAISNSQATMDRLADSLKYVGPTSRALGISIEEITSALSLLYNAGLEASQAGTYLRQGLQRLQAPTREAQKALDALGLTAEEVSPQYNTLAKIVDNFNKKGAGLIENAGLLGEVFDLRAMTAFQVLFQQGSESLLAMQKRITDTSKASIMAQVQIDTLRGAFKLLKSAAQEAAIIIGDNMKGALRALGEFLRGVIKDFNALPEWIQKLIVMIPMLGAALGLLIGPTSYLLGMLPNLIMNMGKFASIIGLSLGPMTAIIAALTAVGAAFYYLVTAERRARDERDKILEQIQLTNNKMISNVENTRNLADEYETLASKSGRTEIENRRLKEIYSELDKIYPDVISGTSDFADRLNEVQKVAVMANNKLAKLYETQRSLAKLKIQIEITDLQKQIDELSGDMLSRNLWEKITRQWSEGIYFTEQSLNSLNNVLSDTEQAVNELVSKDLTDGIGKTFFDDLVYSLEQLGTTETGAKALADDYQNITEKVVDLKAELLKAKNENSGNTSELEKQLEFFETISGAYTIAVNKAGDLLELNSSLADKKALLLKLEQGIGKVVEDKTPETSKAVFGGEAPDAETLKKKNDLEFEMKKRGFEAQLEMLKLYSDKNYQNAKEYIDKELEYKLFMLEYEKSESLRIAKETGASELKIEESFLDSMIAVIQEHRRKRIESDKAWIEKSMELEQNRLKFQSRVDKDSLDYDSEKYEEAMLMYRNHLLMRLAELKEWSTEYVSVLSELKDLEKRIFEEQNKEIITLAEIMSSSIADAWSTLMDELVRKGNAAKIKLKDIFNAIYVGFLDTIGKMVGKLIESGLTKLFTSLFATAVGGPAGGIAASALQTAGGSIIDLAQPAKPSHTGSEVIRGGLVKVSPQEIIVPASIRRKHSRTYDDAMGGGKSVNNNINVSFNISNPIVNDNKYWDKVYQDHLIPVADKFKKRIAE